MEEQFMFTRVHDALDIPTPPGAYERLRAELTKKPVRPFRWPALQMRTSSMGFKFAAGLVVVAIAVAVAATMIAVRTGSTSPVGARMSVGTYQGLMHRDWAAANAALNPCNSSHARDCAGVALHAVPPVQHWLDDMNNARPPERFAVVDAELRAHLAHEINALDVVARTNAANAGQIDAFLGVVAYDHDWSDVIVTAIVASQQVSDNQYRESVAKQRASLASCFACNALLDDSSGECSSIPVASCFDLVDLLGGFIATFQAALVQNAAPADLLAADSRLQADFRAADDELLALKLDAALQDLTAFTRGSARLRVAVSEIDADAVKIIG